MRQRPSRYAFRAGRNLPDKEFRYLRTVIVTAAIDRGFGSQLAPLPLTFRHWAGVSPYTSACALAGTCVFGKQSLGPLLCDPSRFHAASRFTLAGHPFSRSYGVNLPSSLTRDHSSTLVLLRPATCVGLRYGRSRHPPPGFSWRRGSIELPSVALRAFPLLERHRRTESSSAQLRRGNSNATLDLPHPAPAGTYRPRAVTEYQPFVHRLRLSASA